MEFLSLCLPDGCMLLLMKVRLPSLIFTGVMTLAIAPQLPAAPPDEAVCFTLNASPDITLEAPAPASSLTPRLPDYLRSPQPASPRLRWDLPAPQQDLLLKLDSRFG